MTSGTTGTGLCGAGSTGTARQRHTHSILSLRLLVVLAVAVLGVGGGIPLRVTRKAGTMCRRHRGARGDCPAHAAFSCRRPLARTVPSRPPSLAPPPARVFVCSASRRQRQRLERRAEAASRRRIVAHPVLFTSVGSSVQGTGALAHPRDRAALALAQAGRALGLARAGGGANESGDWRRTRA